MGITITVPQCTRYKTLLKQRHVQVLECCLIFVGRGLETSMVRPFLAAWTIDRFEPTDHSANQYGHGEVAGNGRRQIRFRLSYVHCGLFV